MIAHYPPIVLRVDVRNLKGQGVPARPRAELKKLAESASALWGQCGIRFVVRKAENADTAALKIPARPETQDQLSQIAAALNPKGFDGAIPLTVAGEWNIYVPESKIHLHGLGWVFEENSRISRIGAMLTSKYADSAPLAGHELGHALSLGHSSLPDNLMAGGTKLTPEQCAQARSFAERSLGEFRIAAPSDRLRKELGLGSLTR